jgi:Tol biopolymer transport system component
MFTKAVSGDSSTVHLHESPNIQFPLSWSQDGSLLAFAEYSNPDKFKVWLLPMADQSSQPIDFAAGELLARDASFSPAGDWIAYASDEEGQRNIFVREFVRGRTGSGLKWKVSRNGGGDPIWARDGRELFYRSLDGKRLLSVSIRTEPELEIGEESVILEGLRLPAPGWQSSSGAYDVSSDGERFLMVLENEAPETMELVVVVNWGEELKRLVPTN